MIGSGLKKLATQYGMKVSQGVAYGALQGYAATMSEGAGFKQIIFTTKFTDPARKAEFMDAVNAVNIQQLYRVQKLGIGPRSIQVIFHDNPGTMGKIAEFLGWFIPLLELYGATPANICTECGFELTGGRWVLVGNTAYYLHDGCAQKVLREIDADATRQKEEDTGSYLKGALGALGGALLGAIAWAVVLSLGYVTSLVGLVIGFLSLKGYDLLKGKQGKAKIAILIVAIIVGVLLGTFLAECAAWAQYVDILETPAAFLAVMANEPEYRSAVLGNAGMGLFFAALGTFALVWQAGKSVSTVKASYLE